MLYVVLIPLLCVLAFACANVNGIINPAYQPFKDANIADNQENGGSYASESARMIPLGGRVDIASGESFEGIDNAATKGSSSAAPAISGSLSGAVDPPAPTIEEPQFSRSSYEVFHPTLDDAVREIQGFFLIDGAELIPERSIGSRGERFESYDLAFRLPEGTNYSEVVKAYAARLDPGYYRKDRKSDTGSSTYFRIEKMNWNKVISIYGSVENSQIEIRVLFNKLMKK